MATVQERIDGIIRVNLDDDIKSRWTDQQLLAFVKQAVRRAQAVGHKNRFEFMRSKSDFTLPANSTQRLLPTDFIVQSSIWRKDTNREIDNISVEDYETQKYTEELSKYIIDSGYLEFNQGSENDVPIRLRYYQDALPDALMLQSNMPWNGRLDYPICDYVQVRALNVDRYNTNPDAALLNDMEDAILTMYQSLEPTMAMATGGFV